MRGGDERIQVLDNTNTDSSDLTVKVGGTYIWAIEGTFNGGSFKLQVKNANGTYTDIAGASLSAAGFLELKIAPGSIIKAVESGTTSAMYSTLVRVPA